MAAPLLTLQDIGLGFGGPLLFDGLELSLARNDRVCLVGRNGSGKSTLLKVAAGLVEPDRGERTVQSGCRIAYLPQEPDLAGFATAADYVAGGLPAAESGAAFRVDAMLDAMKLDGARAPASLSGGEARRAALARALVGEPDVLLLDEPTNHLDIAAIEWLEAELAAFRGAFILVSHDRAFLNRLTRAVLWLDRGVVRRLDEGFAAFEAWSEDILRREEVERAKLDKLIAEETRWSHQGITARRRRDQGRLRRLHELRAERARQLGRTGSVKLQADSGLVSGRLVVEADAVGKAFDGRAVVRDFSTRILRGDRIGIIGPNGAGKTTLLRLLIGDLAPDTGRVRLGTNLAKVYLDQRRASLDPARTLWETLCESGGDQVVVRGRSRHVVGYLRDFLFEERQAKSPVGSLSGGERNRLLLARALARPSNFLALDEPTNDLDMDTLDLLQEMLADYDGTLLLVSHDRDFLDRVVTSTIVMTGDGRAVEYAGGYSDYLRQRPPEAARPEPGRTRAAKPAPQDRPAPKRPGKLSYKQQRALEELPARIAALEGEIAGLEGRLGDAALYARDPDAFRRGAARLEAARAELAAAEEEWLELELLRETLTAGAPERGDG